MHTDLGTAHFPFVVRTDLSRSPVYCASASALVVSDPKPLPLPVAPNRCLLWCLARGFGVGSASVGSASLLIQSCPASPPLPPCIAALPEPYCFQKALPPRRHPCPRQPPVHPLKSPYPRPLVSVRISTSSQASLPAPAGCSLQAAQSYHAFPPLVPCPFRS